MSFSDKIRRLFAPASRTPVAGEPAAPDELIGAPGVSGIAIVEDAEAAENVGVDDPHDAPSEPAS